MKTKFLLITALILALLGFSPYLQCDSKHSSIEMLGIDGGSVAGIMVPNALGGISTLRGNMDMRLGMNWTEPGTTMNLQHLSVIPQADFGSCYIGSSNWWGFEIRFPDFGLDFESRYPDGDRLLAYSVNYTLPEYPEITGLMDGCLALFKWGSGGKAFPVDSPLDADGFMLTGSRYFLDSQEHWWVNQIGYWIVD